jgi:tryptophanyl-tRNA synthetase
VRALTGIKPTATPHVGNLLGAIEPALRLQESSDAYFFIADLHALTTLHDAALMRRYTREVAATWLAFGLDPKRTTLWVQSDVPEVCELAWILGCVTGLGLLERAHAYKAARDKGLEISAGTFFYPVLMAADILAFDTDVVPVGKDQVQHVEMARDMAAAFNSRFGDVLKLPQAAVRDEVATIIGLDGRKMSKSYGNTIEALLPAKQLRKKVMSIVTDSKGVEEPKDPDTDHIFALYKLFASPEEAADLAARYRAGGLGYGHAKQELYEAMEARLGPARANFEAWMADTSRLDAVLEDGAVRARRIARDVLQRVRNAIGISPVSRGIAN